MADTTTLTLAEFVAARIAEDETAARQATPVGEARTFYSSFGEGRDDWGCYYFNVPPARVLAECEAKRRIVEDFETLHRDYRETHSETTEYRRFQATVALAHLAAVYADHPDYRDEWRP